jgi:flagellar basal-body rod protein FlgG
MASQAMHVGGSGMAAAALHLEIIANNVANSSTDGFKRSSATFADIFYDVAHAANGTGPTPTPLGVSFGQGASLATTPTDFRAGPIVPGTDLDVAINGPGFFRVVDTQGNTFYTRRGSFQPKGIGSVGPINLQLAEGTFLLDPLVTLPGVNGVVTVSNTGVIRQGDTVVGQIELVRFFNPDGLLPIADTLFVATPAAGPEIVGLPGEPGFGETAAGFLEGSNVDVAAELVDVLLASRAFSVNARSFQAGNDEVLSVINLVDNV